MDEAPVDEFLDDRCADHDNDDEQERRGTTRPVRETRCVLLKLIIAERVGPDGLERQIHGRDEDDLAEHADPDAENVAAPDAQPVVGGEASAAEPTRHMHHRDEVAAPRDHHRHRHHDDRSIAASAVPADAQDHRTEHLADEPGDRPCCQRNERCDRPIAWPQERGIARPASRGVRLTMRRQERTGDRWARLTGCAATARSSIASPP